MKYHGGKYFLRKKICGMMVPHDIYIEPFFGAGHVFFEKAPSRLEIINDANWSIMDMWTTIRDRPNELINHLKSIPYSIDSFQKMPIKKYDQVLYAAQIFIKYRMSIGGRGKSFARPSQNRSRRGMPDNISGWLSAIDLIESNTHRLHNTDIRIGLDALNVIQSYLKEPNCLIYLDPPYLPTTRKSPNVYNKEMTLTQHEQLVKSIEASTAKIILSGYDNDLYNTILSQWKKEIIPMKLHSSGGSKKRVANEVLWYNYG
jgi:DNA adenine methylase